MTRVLYMAGSGLHAHSYGDAFLFDGLKQIPGIEVINYPVNPTFFLGSPEDRDDCDLDSDLFYRPNPFSFNHADPDVLIMTVPQRVVLSDHVVRVGVDMSDSLGNTRGAYAEAMGRCDFYFKRELPAGESWAYPLPLTYPLNRSTFKEQRSKFLFYHATNHGGGGPGIPRMKIKHDLELILPPDRISVHLTPGQGKGHRLSPEAYHELMVDAWVGISWNGAANWDCNRFWENFAFGLLQVAEHPRIEIPNPPISGVHCIYVDSPDKVKDVVIELYKNPEATRHLARLGHEFFKENHSSVARATYLLKQIGVL